MRKEIYNNFLIIADIRTFGCPRRFALANLAAGAPEVRFE